VFRYLRGDGCPIPPDAPIKESGYEELVSRNDTIIDLLPDRLLVEHAYDAFLLLSKRSSLQRRKSVESSHRQHDRNGNIDEEEEREIKEAIALSMQPRNYDDDYDDDLYSPITHDDRAAQTETDVTLSDKNDDDDDSYSPPSSTTHDESDDDDDFVDAEEGLFD